MSPSPNLDSPAPLDLGDLRRVTPIDASFGLGRGRPVDRHYIEGFLAQHAADVHGAVLEVGDNEYTRRFGGSRVAQSDILHADASNPHATVVADLTDAGQVPDASFDCFICTQTLTYVYVLERAVATIHRILKPGGVLLVSVPGISAASPYDRDHWGEYWRFTSQSLTRLLADRFGKPNVQVEGYGNVLASIAFLHGLAIADLSARELDHRDPAYEMLVAGRAVKAA